MSIRWVAFFLWAAVAASAVAWGLKLFVSSRSAPASTTVAAVGTALRGDITRVLGPDPVVAVEEAAAPSPAAARFQLIGVLAPKSADAVRSGVALIAVDGKTAKAFRVGAAVDGDTIVQRVRARGADLGPAGAKPTVQLELAPVAAAATGTLPAAGPGGAAVPPPGVPVGVPPGVRPGLPVAPPLAAQRVPVAPPAPVPPGVVRPAPVAAPLAVPPPTVLQPSDGSAPPRMPPALSR